MSTFQSRADAIKAAASPEVTLAMGALKSVSTLDKTMNVSSLYPAFESVLAMSIDDPSEAPPSVSIALVRALRKVGFKADLVPASTLAFGTLSKVKDVVAMSESGAVEVLFSCLTGMALIFETKFHGR